MNACMDFIGNQYLLDQYHKAADVQDKGKILFNLVERLETDGFSREQALHEVRDAVGSDEQARAALLLAEQKHFKAV